MNNIAFSARYREAVHVDGDGAHQVSVPRAHGDTLIDDASPDAEETFIGAGRGARVFSFRNKNGVLIAKKTFVGSGLARLVHQVFFGSDNPYVWDPTALEEAVLRRRVLNRLAQWWFKNRMRVAAVYRARWNDELNVNEWTMEFIDGRPALLRQPFSKLHEDEITDLVDNIMRPLQRCLIDAGFDGAAWQAGLYNPVATSNFLRRIRADGQAEWVWIDVESGVPALFPANPLGLFRYYLPRWLKFGRPLFDDVDLPQLYAYLASNEQGLREELGDEGWLALMSDVGAFDIASSQSRWKRLGRLQRGIEARLRRKEITPEQADYYSRHKMRWIAREIGNSAQSALGALGRRLAAWFHPRLWWIICRESVRLMYSDAYRTQFARRYVASGIERWHKRKQLDNAEVDALMAELHGSGSANYLTDFGMHLATKPLVKLVTWIGVPALFALGFMNAITLAILVVGGGAIVRTIYTMIRIVNAYRHGHSRPWIALFTGTLPVLGNVAFPLQLLFDGVSGGRQLSQFIIYDTATRVGRSIPIWGGADTLTEHRANRAADWLFAFAEKLKSFFSPSRSRRPKPLL